MMFESIKTASKVAYWVKVPDAKPDLSLVSGTYMVGENGFLQVVF